MAENEDKAKVETGQSAAAPADVAASEAAADIAGTADAESAAADESADVADAAQPDAAAADAAPDASAPAEPQRKRKPKRGLIVGGVVVVVLVAAVAGFWVWHEQPSFCNAICHSPMDYYVESYESQDYSMASALHAALDYSCLDCHEPELTEQLSEVLIWIADEYPMTADGTMLATGTELASEEFCAKSGCHDMDEVVEATWGFEDNDEQYNPHSSHQDYALECGDCHKAHETSVLMCNNCHTLNMPEGWEAPYDSAEE